ncbi:MAG: hypothetical protein JW882_06270 [Deltaproteobacteria bacterium]|nr:hypothetical protein [Deltaproteobacteria bacterium]
MKRTGVASIIVTLLCVVMLIAPGAINAADKAKSLKIGGLICLTGWFSSMDI